MFVFEVKGGFEMKRFKRLNAYILVALCGCLSYAFALGFDDPSMGTASLVTETTKSCELSDGLEKKEMVYTISYNYPEDLKDSSYKYVTVRMNFTYFSNVINKVLAVASLESNFRYNSVTKQAECLSTSRGNVLNDKDCVLSIFARRANRNTEVGASVAEIKFTNKGKPYEKNVYRISCDYMGNITYS